MPPYRVGGDYTYRHNDAKSIASAIGARNGIETGPAASRALRSEAEMSNESLLLPPRQWRTSES